MKTCTKCAISKAESEFYQKTPTRLHSRCKVCHNKAAVERMKKTGYASVRKYQKSNPEVVRAAVKRWKERNPDKNRAHMRIKKHRQRARLRNLSEHHTEAEWQSLLNKFDRRCLRCGIEEMFAMLTRDHVIPLSRGGSNTIDNIQPLCASCNESKSTAAVDYRPIHVNRNQ